VLDEVAGNNDLMDQVDDMSLEEINAHVRQEIDSTTDDPVNTGPEAEETTDLSESLDLSDMIGNLTSGDAGQAQDNSAQEPAHAPNPEPVHQQDSATETRFKDLTDRLERAERVNEMLVARGLGGGEEPIEEIGVDLGDMDQRTFDHLEPVARAGVEAKTELEAFREEMAPLRQQANDFRMANHLEQSVQGFKPNMLPGLKEWTMQQPAEVQERYGQDVMGAEILASRYVAQSGGQPGGQQHAHPMSAQAAPGMGGNPQQGGTKKISTAEDLNNLSDAQFAALEQQLDFAD